MTEEAARVADGGLSNASRSCAGLRRDPTRRTRRATNRVARSAGAFLAAAMVACGRPVVLWGPHLGPRVAQQEKKMHEDASVD